MPPFQQLCQISALLELPRSTVSAVIVNLKCQGATTAQPRSGRPRKLTGWHRRVLKRVARKNGLSSVATLTTSSKLSLEAKSEQFISVCQELDEMGYHDRAAAHKLQDHHAQFPASAEVDSGAVEQLSLE